MHTHTPMDFFLNLTLDRFRDVCGAAARLISRSRESAREEARKR